MLEKKKQYEMWIYWVYLKSFLFPLGMLLRPLIRAVPKANLTFLGSLHFLISLFKLPFAKCEDWKTAHFQNEKFCFQGQILQQIKIRSWSNDVCCSRGISFRWHFWHIHFLSNNVIMKNKVLSYHGLNSRKSSTVADYLHFPSNKNTIIHFF